MTLTYEQALEIATKYHEGQVRKFSGLPYITHPITVAESLRWNDDKIIALLHDVVEDTVATLSELGKLGANKYQLTCIDYMTHNPTETYCGYISNINRADEEGFASAKRVKVADIKHNMSDLEKGCMRDKYELALFILENDGEHKMKLVTTKAECQNLDDIDGDGMSIQRRFIFNKKTKIITIRILRKVGYSWQNAGLDVHIHLDEQKAFADERGLVLEW